MFCHHISFTAFSPREASACSPRPSEEVCPALVGAGLGIGKSLRDAKQWEGTAVQRAVANVTKKGN